MATLTKNPAVDAFLERQTTWREELAALRRIILDCGLEEQLKWGQPCYSLDNKNVVLIHAFKDYCAILFMKGVLLKDEQGVLIQQTENVQSGRHIRFADKREIAAQKDLLKAYIKEAIEIEKSGQKTPRKTTADFPMPDELRARFAKDPDLKEAFAALTPGRQRAYLLHFAGAKQAKTREARIEKYVEAIREGKGLDD